MGQIPRSTERISGSVTSIGVDPWDGQGDMSSLLFEV